MCIFNARSVHKYLGYRENVVRIYIRPLMASVVMGIVSYAAYRLLYLLIPSNAVCLLVAIVASIICYFVLIIKLRAVNEKELKAFPNGAKLVRTAHKLHLL